MVMIFGDDLRRSRYAVATYCLALLMAGIFFATVSDPKVALAFENLFSFIPLKFSLHPAMAFYTLVTAQFLHIDIWHLVGNLIFFVAIGRSIENLLGSLYFVFSFLGLGALSFLGSWILNPSSSIQIVGASGAISFLLGGYVVLFPKARLKIIPFIRFLALPAWMFAGFWVAVQFFGLLSLGEQEVAYGTHIGGLIIGVVSALAWKEFGFDTDEQLERLRKQNRASEQ